MYSLHVAKYNQYTPFEHDIRVVALRLEGKGTGEYIS